MISTVCSRIAPTPSGYLHRGNAYSFLLTETLVRRHGGSLRLRIDDLDALRVRPEYLADIFKMLDWLCINPDEGPVTVADHARHYTQQLRIPAYDAMLQRLAACGSVFACSCSRMEIMHGSADGQYPGTCREKGLALNTPGAAWRMRTDAADIAAWHDGIRGAQCVNLYQHARDFIIRRRDGLPAYHIASLCDDVAYGISLIVRGEDLRHSTAVQLHLAKALALEPFLQCDFYHHPLLQDDASKKLSKSAGSYSLHAAREAGMTAAHMRHKAAGWYQQFLPESK